MWINPAEHPDVFARCRCLTNQLVHTELGGEYGIDIMLLTRETVILGISRAEDKGYAAILKAPNPEGRIRCSIGPVEGENYMDEPPDGFGSDALAYRIRAQLSGKIKHESAGDFITRVQREEAADTVLVHTGDGNTQLKLRVDRSYWGRDTVTFLIVRRFAELRHPVRVDCNGLAATNAFYITDAGRHILMVWSGSQSVVIDFRDGRRLVSWDCGLVKPDDLRSRERDLRKLCEEIITELYNKKESAECILLTADSFKAYTKHRTVEEARKEAGELAKLGDSFVVLKPVSSFTPSTEVVRRDFDE